MIVVSHSYFIRALFKNYTHQHAFDKNASLPNTKIGDRYHVADLGNLKLKVSISRTWLLPPCCHTPPPRGDR